MSIKRTIKFLIISLALCFVGIFFGTNQAQALNDPNGRLTNLSIDGKTDNVAQNVTFVRAEEGKTVSISWAVSTYPNGYDYFSVRYGCGYSAESVTTWTGTINSVTAYSSVKNYSTSWTLPSYSDNSKYCKIWIVAKSNTKTEPVWGPNSGVVEILKKTNARVNTISVSPTTLDLGTNVTLTGKGYDISEQKEAGFYIYPQSSGFGSSKMTVANNFFSASSYGSTFSKAISTNTATAGKTYCVRAYVGITQASASEDKCFTINTTRYEDTSGYSCESGYSCTQKASGATYTVSRYGSLSAAKDECEKVTTCHAPSGNYFYYCSGTECYKTTQTFTSSASCYDTYKASCYTSSDCGGTCSKSVTKEPGYTCYSGQTACTYVADNAEYKISSYGSDSQAKYYCGAYSKCQTQQNTYYYCDYSQGCISAGQFTNLSSCDASFFTCYTENTCGYKCPKGPFPPVTKTPGYSCNSGACDYVEDGAQYPNANYQYPLSACSANCSTDTTRQLSFCGSDNACHNVYSTMATCKANATNVTKTCYEGYNCSGNTCTKAPSPIDETLTASIGTISYSNGNLYAKAIITKGTFSKATFFVSETQKSSSIIYPTLNQEFSGTISGAEAGKTYNVYLNVDGKFITYKTYTTPGGNVEPPQPPPPSPETLAGTIGTKSYSNGTLTVKGTWTLGNNVYNAYFAVYPTTGEGKASALLSGIYKNQEFSRTITGLSAGTSYSLILYLNGTEVKREIYTTPGSTEPQETLAGAINSYSYSGGVLTIKATWTSGSATNASFALYPIAKATPVITGIVKGQEITGTISGLTDNTDYELQFKLNGMLMARQNINTTVKATPVTPTAKILSASYNPTTKKATINIQTTGFDQTYYAKAFFGKVGTTESRQAPIPPQQVGNVISLPSSFEIPHSSDNIALQAGSKYQIYYEIRQFNTNTLIVKSNTLEFDVAQDVQPEKLTAPNVIIENIYDNSSDKTAEAAFNDKKSLTENSTKSLIYAKAYVKYFEGTIQYATYVKIRDLSTNTENAPVLADSGTAIIGQESGTTNWIGRVLSKYSPNNYFGKEYCYFVRAKKVSNNAKFTDSDWAQSQEFCVIGTPWVITDNPVYTQDGKYVTIQGRITSFGKYPELNAYFKMYAQGYETKASTKKSWQKNPAKKSATVIFVETIDPYAYGNISVPDDAWDNFCYKACVIRNDNSNELCGQEKCFSRKQINKSGTNYLAIGDGTVINNLNTTYSNLYYSWPITVPNQNIDIKYWFSFYKKDKNGNTTVEKEIQGKTESFGTADNASKKIAIQIAPGIDATALRAGEMQYCVIPHAEIVETGFNATKLATCFSLTPKTEPVFNLPSNCSAETLDATDIVQGTNTLKAKLNGRINDCLKGLETSISKVEGTFVIYKNGVITGKESDPLALTTDNQFGSVYNISNTAGASYSYEAKAYAYDKAGKKYPFLIGARKLIKEVPPQPKQSVKLISPNGGETFTIGDTISVKLEKGIATDKVYLFLQDDKTTSPKNIKINTEAIVGNEYSFVLTKELVSKITNQIAGSKYKMDAVIYANNNPYIVAVNDATDGYFSIKDSGSSDTDTQQKIKLISPNGGEQYNINDTINVSWENKQQFTQVYIGLRDYETEKQSITTITNTGINYGINSYSFKITPEILKRFQKLGTGGTKYKIELYLYDTQQNNKLIGKDDSDNYFAVMSPTDTDTKEATLQITAPIAGDKVKVGDNLEIKWTGSNLPADGKIVLVATDDRTDYNKLITTDASLSKGSYSLKIDSDFVNFFENQQGKTYNINNSAFKILAVAVKSDWGYINAGKPLTAESGEFNIVKSSTNTSGFDIIAPADGDIIKIGENVVTKWISNSLPQGSYLSLIFKTKDGKMSTILTNVDLANGSNTFSTNEFWAKSYESKYGSIENADFYIYGVVRDATNNIFYQDKSGYFKIKRGEQSDDNQTEPEDDQSEEKGCSVIQISTATCLPCQKMKPISAKVAQLFGTTLDETVNNQTAYTSKIVNNIDGVKFFYIDVSAFRPSDRTSLVAKYFPQGDGNFVPQILIYKNGKDVVLARGTTDETEYKNLVNKYCGTSIYNEDDNQTEPEDDQVKPEEDIKGLSIKTLKPTTDSSKTLLQAQILEIPAGKSMQVEWISRPKDGEYGTDPLRWTLVDANYNVKQVFTKGVVALQMSGVSFIIDNQLSNYCFTAVGIVDGKEEKATNEECFK